MDQSAIDLQKTLSEIGRTLRHRHDDLFKNQYGGFAIDHEVFDSPILILEQVIMPMPKGSSDFCKRLLQINRTLVHGAFVLDEEGTTLLFRDTLQLENLDRNELEGSIDALSLAMAEYGGELVSFARG